MSLIYEPHSARNKISDDERVVCAELAWCQRRRRSELCLNRRPIHDGESRAVYSGADQLGHIVQRDNGFVAYGRRHEPLGVFDSTIEAVAAIMRAAGGVA